MSNPARPPSLPPSNLTLAARCKSLPRFLPAVLLGLATGLPSLPAQIQILSFGTAVAENFDSLGTTGTATLPAHWRMSSAGDSSVSWTDAGNFSTTTLQASSGSPTGGGRYNWGQSATDRAIGFMTSSGYASPNQVMAHFSNATGATIDQVSIAFDYERYRVNTAPASISFFSSTDGTNWTAIGAGDSGPFSTGSSAYGFASPVSSNSYQVTLASLNLAPGADFFLRWQFSTGGSNSQGLGLDNFSLTASAIPEPSTYAAIGGITAFVGAIWQRRRRRSPSVSTSRDANFTRAA